MARTLSLVVVLVLLSVVCVSGFAQSYNVSTAWQGAGSTVYVVNSGGGDYEVWNYYQLLTVSNSSVVPVGFQLNFTVWYGVGTNSQGNFYLSGHGSPDFSDLRFVDGHGVLLNATYSVMVVNSYVHVWVKLEDSLTIVMYYGNPYVGSDWADDLDVWHNIISSGAVLALPMLEGSGTTLYDHSGYANNGVISGASWVTTGKFGNALSFLDDDYVTLPDVASLQMGTGNFSSLVYVKPLNVSGDKGLFGGEAGGWSMYLNNAYPRGLKVDTAGATASSKAIDPLVVWVVGVVFDSGSTTNNLVYWRGSENESIVDSDTISFNNDYTAGASTKLIGVTKTATNNFSGVLSGAYILNFTLTSAEIVDFAAYFPRCISGHAGALYFGEWMTSLAGVVSAGEVSPNLVVAAVGLADYMPFFGLLVFVLLGLFVMFSRVPVLMIVVGVVGFAVAGLVFTTYHGVGVLFSPYSELLLALVCVFDFAVAGRMVKRG